MAKAFYYDQKKYWALTVKAEDFILIDAYLRIKPFVSASNVKFVDFEYYYFEKGRPVADKNIMMLNSLLRRKKMPEFGFPDTHSDSYTLLNGEAKCQERRTIKGQLEAMSGTERELVLQAKWTEIRALAPRDPVYDAKRALKVLPDLRLVGAERFPDTQIANQLHDKLTANPVALAPRPKAHPPCVADPQKVAAAVAALKPKPTPVAEVPPIALPCEPEMGPAKTAAAVGPSNDDVGLGIVEKLLAKKAYDAISGDRYGALQA